MILRQFIKYCIVGGSGVAVNGALFFTCYSMLKMPLTLAWGVGVGGSVVTNFVLNRNWTFKK